MRAVAAIGLALLAVSCLAQDNKDEKAPPINPDRPDATNGAGITPSGRLVLETGYRQSASNGMAAHFWGDGPTLRYGVNDRFEVRFVAPTYAIASAGFTGWQDTSIGFKYLLKDGGDAGGFRSPSYALAAGTSLPTGSRAWRQKRSLPTFTGIVDWDFGHCGELAGNLSLLESLDGAGSSFFVWTASLSYSHVLVGLMSGFFEGIAEGPEDSGHGFPALHFADTGIQYLLNDDCMFDAFVGAGLDRRQRNAFFGTGVSFRF